MVDIVIMAHGRQERLRAELGTQPKHCLSLGDETILERTVRLVRGLSDGLLHVCHPGPEIREPPCETLIASMRHFASGRGSRLFLLGDVVWSRDALERVVTNTLSAPQFFGRHENPLTKKWYGELFAVRVDPAALVPHLGCANLWGLKAALRAPMVLIDDWTDDIDTPEDLSERLPKLREFVNAEQGAPFRPRKSSETAGQS